ERRMRKFGVLMGLGAALLLCLNATAQEPNAEKGASKSRFQRGRSRGFGGFADWDSRRGSYDRSRRQDAKDQDKPKAEDDRGRRDDRRSGPPTPSGRRGDDRRNAPAALPGRRSSDRRDSSSSERREGSKQ